MGHRRDASTGEPTVAPSLIVKADADYEADTANPSNPKQKASLTRLRTEMKKAGVLVNAIDLEPSGKSKRLIFKNNDLRILDGPFSESKELIGGFVVMELSGMDEAIAMSRRYATILGGTLEMDIRPLSVEPADAAAPLL